MFFKTLAIQKSKCGFINVFYIVNILKIVQELKGKRSVVICISFL